MSPKACSDTPKFLASTSRGGCASQSVTENILSSLKFTSSKTSRNSQPSPSRPWTECGMPDGKFHRSPSPTSSWNARPSFIDGSDPRPALEHEGPLGRLVPVQLADPAGL